MSRVKKFNWYPDSPDNGLLFQRLVSAQDLKKKKRCLNYIFVVYNMVMWWNTFFGVTIGQPLGFSCEGRELL